MAIVGSKIKIEKGIPIPSYAADSFRNTLRQMEIGDSVFFSGENIERTRSAITSAISIVSRDLKRRYLTRKMDGGVRLWRYE